MPAYIGVYKKLKNFLFGNMPEKVTFDEIENKNCHNCKIMAMFVKVTEKKLLQAKDEQIESVKPLDELPRYTH